MASISTVSKEYIKVPVAYTVAGVVSDPTALVVELAFPLKDVDPVTGDWKTGSWESANARYWARLLVGPGSTFGALARGDYDVWVRVTATPEVPAMKAGRLQVT